MDDLHTMALIYIAFTVLCSLILTLDLVTGHRPMMGVMYVVWPVTALYAGPLALIAYYAVTRETTPGPRPFWLSVVAGTLHCGSGCLLGDIAASIGLLYLPVVVAGSALYGSWVVEYALAFLIGIGFQYYALRPMRSDLPRGRVILAALKADTLSLSFWQIGMYAWMSIYIFLIFHRPFSATDPVFWLMMQTGMLLGFLTAYPVNWWLIKTGVKEAM